MDMNRIKEILAIFLVHFFVFQPFFVARTPASDLNNTTSFRSLTLNNPNLYCYNLHTASLNKYNPYHIFSTPIFYPVFSANLVTQDVVKSGDSETGKQSGSPAPTQSPASSDNGTSSAHSDNQLIEDNTVSFQDAEADWNAHRWKDAVKKYKKIANTSSPHACKAHIQIGKYYKYQGRWNEAIREYEKAIAKGIETRDIEDAQTSIAAVYLSKGDYPKALSLLREVIRNTTDWQQVKYSNYWIKELNRRMAFGEDYHGCNTCGSSALKTLLILKGIEFSDSEIDTLINLADSGASLMEIKHAAEANGLQTHGVKISVDLLKDLTMPIIVLTHDPNHYLIVTGISEEGINITDAENGNVSYCMPEAEFEKIWEGYALLFSDVPSEITPYLLSDDEMKGLKGKVCYCCPESNNGTQNPHVENTTDSCPGSSIIVNTVNLNMMYQATDLLYSGRGPAIEITRTFNADDSRTGTFGNSWTFNYNVTVTENSSGSIDVRRETGTIHSFRKSSSGTYNPPAGVYDTLSKNSDGTYSLKLKGSKSTQYFNSSGKLTAITDRNKNSVTFTYDSSGNLTTITDAVGRITTLSYGSNGKISSITNPFYRTVSYSYDSSGNLTSYTDMEGNTVSYAYDENSNMTGITTSKGTTLITYEYSSEGYALASVTDPSGNVKSYGRYNSDYNIRVLDANGNPTYYYNNRDGYTEKITDALENAVTYGYSGGNRTSVKDPNGNTTNLAYDSNGNVTKITDPLSNSVQFTYDSSDNLTKLTDPSGNSYAYEYDDNDNLTSISNPENGTTTFSYNSYGELSTLTDAKGNSLYFTYDGSGNLSTATNPSGGVDSYTYDTIGRIATHKDANGNTTSYVYDDLDRVTKITYPDRSTKNYAYDCCALSSVADSNGTLSFGHDTLKRLTSFTDLYGKTISYGYDKAGNLTSLTYPDGKVVNYAYNAADRLIKVTDWLNNVTNYEYDAAGNLTKTTYPDGSTIIHEYDNAGRMKSILDYSADATINSRYQYTLDALGNRTAMSYYQPLMATPASQNVSYDYDNDNRLLTAGTTTFSYDNNGNLTSKTVGSSKTTYTPYLNNNMLLQVTTGGKTYSYKYDGLGNRIVSTTDSGTTRYVVDPSGDLSTILAETDNSGNITAYYVYGLGLISKITPEGKAYYYHYDGIGSTIAITDASGNIVNKYAYDAFGKVLKETETISNPFKYVGRFGVMDEGNGLFYMRARYYDSEVGRFINKDPIGLAGGLNMYAYVGNNPVNGIDPIGLYSPGPFDYLTRYGNWGGEHWSGGKWIEKGGLGSRSCDPVDWVDAWWKKHDIDSIDNPKGNTNRIKFGALQELLWRKIVRPWTVTPYQEIAVLAFFIGGHD